MKVLELSKSVLGEEHPSTLTITVNLGSAIEDQVRLVGAREIFLNVLESLRRVLGDQTSLYIDS